MATHLELQLCSLLCHCHPSKPTPELTPHSDNPATATHSCKHQIPQILALSEAKPPKDHHHATAKDQAGSREKLRCICFVKLPSAKGQACTNYSTCVQCTLVPEENNHLEVCSFKKGNKFTCISTFMSPIMSRK